MKKLKSLFIGAGVATINIVPAATQAIKPERCSGSCGSCGFACVGSVATIAALGFFTLIFNKIKIKFKKKTA